MKASRLLIGDIECWQERINEAAVIPEARFFDLFFKTVYTVTATKTAEATATVPQPCLVLAAFAGNGDDAKKMSAKKDCEARRKRSLVQDEEDTDDRLEEVSRSIRQAADYEASISSSLSDLDGITPRQPRQFNPITKAIEITVTTTKVEYDKKNLSTVKAGTSVLTCMPTIFILCN